MSSTSMRRTVADDSSSWASVILLWQALSYGLSQAVYLSRSGTHTLSLSLDCVVCINFVLELVLWYGFVAKR